MNESRHTAFKNMKAGDVLRLYKKRFIACFYVLKNKGVASDILVFGSVARNEDTIYSDIDFLIKVGKRSPLEQGIVQEILADWLPYPVHILLDDGKIWIPEKIRKEAIPLCQWN